MSYHYNASMSVEFKAVQCVLKSERSSANAKFCERVYGRNLTQFGAADMPQIDFMIRVLGLNERTHVLDVGCGIGTMAEYIVGVSGTEVTGIDSSDLLIDRAKERTMDKVQRLHFIVGQMDELDLPPSSFDAVVSIDSLYFAKDLKQTIARLTRVLKPKGTMGLFHSQAVGPNDSEECLESDKTTIALALRSEGMRFNAYDQTEPNVELFRRSKETAEALKKEFEAEGNGELISGRIGEGNAVLELAKAGKYRRYFYHVVEFDWVS